MKWDVADENARVRAREGRGWGDAERDCLERQTHEKTAHKCDGGKSASDMTFGGEEGEVKRRETSTRVTMHTPAQACRY